MKKVLLILSIIAVAIGFTGCEDDPCYYNTQTLDLRVMQADWQFDDNTLQYYYHFDVPEITPFVYNCGNWTICREYNSGTADAYQVALPQSVYMTEALADGSIAYYTQHIDYRVGIGYVEIQLTNSDYFYGQEKPESMLFRLQLIY
ncbi:MAG: hypothetical protein UHJ11_01975 [Paludibacteraceae bacterium]|nr:hypothetical protein [Paludibacteraceae bacterium]